MWVRACQGGAILLATASCALLEWREMAGVGLLLLAIIMHEKAKFLKWVTDEEKRRADEDARRLEAIAKREADLKSRVPGQGRKQYRQRAIPPRDE